MIEDLNLRQRPTSIYIATSILFARSYTEQIVARIHSTTLANSMVQTRFRMDHQANYNTSTVQEMYTRCNVSWAFNCPAHQ